MRCTCALGLGNRLGSGSRSHRPRDGGVPRAVRCTCASARAILAPCGLAALTHWLTHSRMYVLTCALASASCSLRACSTSSSRCWRRAIASKCICACEARSGQVRSGQVRPGQVRSGQARSGQVRSGQARSGHAMSRRVKSTQVMSSEARSQGPGPGKAKTLGWQDPPLC